MVAGSPECDPANGFFFTMGEPIIPQLCPIGCGYCKGRSTCLNKLPYFKTNYDGAGVNGRKEIIYFCCFWKTVEKICSFWKNWKKDFQINSVVFQ